jgi:alpha-glucosidase
MQWDATTNAGFSTATPWLPVPPSYKTHNVASEEKNPDSVLIFYQKLLALRHQSKALLDGDYIPLNQMDNNVLAYGRKYKGETVVVVLNMSPTAQKFRLDTTPLQVSSKNAVTLLTTLRKPAKGLAEPLNLRPFDVYIAQVGK